MLGYKVPRRLMRNVILYKAETRSIKIVWSVVKILVRVKTLKDKAEI